MCLDKWIMTAHSTQILQVTEEKVDKLGRYEQISIVTVRIFQQLLLKELSTAETHNRRETQYFANAMSEESWGIGFIPLLISYFVFYHSGLPFLNIEKICNLIKNSKSLLQQYFYPTFWYFFMMTLSNISDKEIYLFGIFLTWIRLHLLHYLIFFFFSEELLNSKIWLKEMMAIFLLTDYKLKCRVASNGKKIILEQTLLQIKENDKY